VATSRSSAAIAEANGEAGKTAEKPAEAKEALRITRIQVETLRVPIVGTAPLISHRFDEKARKAMLEKQTARKSLREVRNPQAEYEASLYRINLNETQLNDGPAKRGRPKAAPVVEAYGFPASAFRKATIGAARFYDKSVTMRGLTQMFMVKGIITKSDPLALVVIEGEPEPREDTVRLPNGNAEVRFRAMFVEWTAMLEFEYVASSIEDESLLSLIAAGGQFVGVGDWRPERVGQFGTYEIDDTGIEKISRPLGGSVGGA
jgi:hypothetical protein